jgi:hypothetical protein
LKAASSLEKDQVDRKVREEDSSHRQVLFSFLEEIANAASSETKESEQAEAGRPLTAA